MITSIEIENLRGIRSGKLEALSPLTILVGPNGCGKSTVLDAILLSTSPSMSQAHQLVEARRQELGGGRWLRWKGQDRSDLIVSVAKEQVCRTYFSAVRPGQSITTVVGLKPSEVKAARSSQEVLAQGRPVPQLVTEVRVIPQKDPARPVPLHQLYTLAVQTGHRQSVLELVRASLPGATSVEILTEEDRPVVHLVFGDYSVPAALVGDGLYRLLRLALELASDAELVLLEEPEVHQHPASLRQSARVILAAVRRGIQVVLTTHSLEFIDVLLAECAGKDLETCSLYRLKLEDGKLLSARLPGVEVARARHEIEDDLR